MKICDHVYYTWCIIKIPVIPSVRLRDLFKFRRKKSSGKLDDESAQTENTADYLKVKVKSDIWERLLHMLI